MMKRFCISVGAMFLLTLGLPAQEASRPQPLTTAAWEECWTALAGDDAAAAFRAMQSLAGAREQTVARLKGRLHHAVAVEEAQLRQWVADLESDVFAVRERAGIALANAGGQAEAALRRKQGELPSLEVSWRIDQLLSRIAQRQLTAEELRSVRAVEALEYIGSPEAKSLLATLARGPQGCRLAAEAQASLDRLGRRGVRAE